MAHTPAGETRELVYRYVRDRLLAGDPPTVRDVQRAFGFKAVESARRHLDLLVEEGRLEKSAGQSRGYRLAGIGAGADGEPGGLRPVLVPLLGRVQAGALTEAIESPERYLLAEGSGGAELFALTVRGESMNGAGILPGDTVIVRRQPAAEDGEIVVAMVDGEATVKTLRRRRGRVELVPANPHFETIIPDPAEVQILGKVVEVRRNLA